VEIELLTSGLLDELEGIVDDSERGEPEKVHLQKAHLLDRLHIEGGDDFIILCSVQRDKIQQWLWRDDDTGSVDARIAHQTFEPHSRVDHLPDLRLIVVSGL